jgi:hypothetical protein
MKLSFLYSLTEILKVTLEDDRKKKYDNINSVSDLGRGG